MTTTKTTSITRNTVLPPGLRAEVAADAGTGGGNLLPSMLAVNPFPDEPFIHSVPRTDGETRTVSFLRGLDQRYLREKYQDLVAHLGDHSSKTVATSAALA